jgi:ATP-binding cassette subfamily B protein
MRLVIRALWPDLRRQRRWLIVAMVAMVGEVVAAILEPWPLKYVVDSVLFVNGSTGSSRLRTSFDAGSLRLLLILSAAAIGIAGFSAVFSYVDDRFTDIAALRAVFDLRRRLFSHLQRLSMSFHDHRDTQVGDLLSRLGSDIQALQDLAAVGLSSLVTNALTLVSAMVIMFWLDWRLAVVVAIFTLPMLVVAQHTTVRMRVALRTARRQEGRVSSVIQEALSAIRLVQSFGREEHESRRAAAESAKSLQASLRAAALQSRLGPAVRVISGVAAVAVTLYGAVLVVQRGITPGELLVFLGYLRSLQSPARQLAKLSYAIGKASAGAGRLLETLGEMPSVAEHPAARRLRPTTGRVQFDGVSFAYPGGRPILRDVSLEAGPGQVIALVGATGAGKTTLVSLLPRFYDPSSGAVLIDGRDIRSYTLRSLRESISLVLQDSLIFRATLAENIAYGRPEAARGEIEAAAAAAGVDAIAARLPDGYDTLISERGGSLSGGEKQRVGIARALLKDAPIVVLDEPTSSLDSLTERYVMQGLERLLAGRTAFIIAHRLASVRRADLVAVLDGGRVVETGTPEELLARPGSLFGILARAQAVA